MLDFMVSVFSKTWLYYKLTKSNCIKLLLRISENFEKTNFEKIIFCICLTIICIGNKILYIFWPIRNSEIRNSRRKLQNSKMAKFENCKIKKTVKFENCKIRKLQNSKIAKFVNWKIRKLQNLKIAEIENC